jgi:hypothetical protein
MVVSWQGCTERARLLERSQEARVHFANAIAALSKALVDGSQSDYEQLRSEVAQAKLLCENAELLLRLHEKQHGC